jgi:hypothetical protein
VSPVRKQKNECNRLSHPINRARWTSDDRLVLQVTLDIACVETKRNRTRSGRENAPLLPAQLNGFLAAMTDQTREASGLEDRRFGVVRENGVLRLEPKH